MATSRKESDGSTEGSRADSGRNRADEAANSQALLEVVKAIIRAESVDAIARGTLEAIRRAFGWAYGSYWSINPQTQSRMFILESGNVDDEFHRTTRRAQFRLGEGLNGRAWKQREVYYVDDIGKLDDCCRAPIARSAGIKSGVCVPLLREDDVVGTMDFFALNSVEMSHARIEVLKTLSLLASDKITKLAKQADLLRIQQMIDNAPTSMMYTDRDLNIRYMNAASVRLLKRIEQYLPCKADEMLGQSIDIFHKRPEHQRRILADPKNLPHHAIIRIGPETADLNVNAITDREGNYLGPMLTWDIVTEKLEAEARQNELAADTTAINTLLVAMTRATTVDEAFSLALSSVRDAYGWAYGSYWLFDAEAGVMRFGGDSGQVSDEFRRKTMETTFREGEGSIGQAWRQRDSQFLSEFAEQRNSPRAQLAHRAGLHTSVVVPVLMKGKVSGAIDFFSTATISITNSRQEALRSIGQLISGALERVDQQVKLDDAKRDLEHKASELMKVARSAAGGDLRIEVGVSGEDDMGRLGTSLAEMVAALKNIIGQVIESASQFAEGSRVISESATYLSESSQNQAATVEEMSASVAQLSESIEQINANASSASTLAEKTALLAKQGGESVDQSIEAMVLIKKSSEQVSDIIQVISEIASQTNLLALNAAIEAARAGEHGLGFAVVADEVRKLAERSSAAAKEITALIKESTRRVADGAQLSEKAGESLATIVSGVQQTAQSIAKIASATHDQSTAAIEVGKAIQDVSRLTETNASSAEQLSASAEELGAQAAALKNVISGFKV
jgi:methyl-accepting chemotaxis protein